MPIKLWVIISPLTQTEAVLSKRSLKTTQKAYFPLETNKLLVSLKETVWWNHTQKMLDTQKWPKNSLVIFWGDFRATSGSSVVAHYYKVYKSLPFSVQVSIFQTIWVYVGVTSWYKNDMDQNYPLGLKEWEGVSKSGFVCVCVRVCMCVQPNSCHNLLLDVTSYEPQLDGLVFGYEVRCPHEQWKRSKITVHETKKHISTNVWTS